MDGQFSVLYHSVMTKKHHTSGYMFDLFSESEEPSGLLETLLDESESLFAKKLSLNDRDWARHPNKHQGGVYVNVEERDSDFFPRLSKKTEMMMVLPRSMRLSLKSNGQQSERTK
jgi:hypothetical protein